MRFEPAIEALKERAWREIAEIDARLARGEIDEQRWHDAVAELVIPAYLVGDNPRAQSGHSGDDARWESARRPIVAAIDRDGSFLDVGCASGYLMECVQRWAAEAGHSVQPFGLEIAPALAELARRRLPQWADRIFVGNARSWLPPRRFDFVRTGLDYAPPGRARELVEHHRVRLEETVAALADEPRTGYELSFALFGADLQPAGRRFAIAETLSHAERLVHEGTARRGETRGTVTYTAA
jgi:SAM-dependent methyltransferase